MESQTNGGEGTAAASLAPRDAEQQPPGGAIGAKRSRLQDAASRGLLSRFQGGPRKNRKVPSGSESAGVCASSAVPPTEGGSEPSEAAALQAIGRGIGTSTEAADDDAIDDQHTVAKKQNKQFENVFEQLISKIEPADFDLLPTLKQWNLLGHFVSIKRNVYCTKRRFEDYGISCSCTHSSGSSVVCDRDCQCGMLFSCCSSNCKCDNTCANKSFQHRPLKKTKLITTEKCGYGLVAEDEIKKGEFVIEYVGEVIDDRTCEERLWKMRRLCDTNFYLCEVSSNMVIDATNKGNMSRFINHSCEPNTEMQKWTVDKETRVGIFALRDIKKEEELTYDYKFVQFGADQDCHCGSSNCRKMLGTTKSINSNVLHNGNSGSSQNHRVKKKKRKTKSENCIHEFLRLWHPKQKMYVACWIVDFDQETKRHTLQFIDLHTEKFNLKEEEWDFLLVD